MTTRHRAWPLSQIATLVLGFAKDHAGSTAILVAGVFFTLSAVFSLSLDIGILYKTKRELQAVADASVLKAVTDLGEAEALVSDVIAANGISGDLSGQPEVVSGRFPPTGYTIATVGTLPIESRFEAASANANALRVTISETPRLYLVNLFFDASIRVSAQAIATNLPLVQLSVRSQAAAIDSDKATVLNGFLSSLLGTSVSFSALGYNGLASADISLLRFMDALGTQVGVSAGSYDAVLAKNVTFPEIAAAVISAIGTDPSFTGDAATVTAVVQQLANDFASVSPIVLGDIISIDPEYPQNAAGARLNLFDLVAGSVEAANAEHGLTSEVSVPINNGVVTFSAAVVEPRQITAIGGVGITVETSQTRLFLVVEPTQALSLPGLNSNVRLPILIETTKGVATVTDISCPTPLPADGTVAVTATPGTLATGVMDIDPKDVGGAAAPVTQPAEIVNAAGLLTVTASAQADYSGTPSALSFVAPFDDNNIQTVSTANPFGTAATSLFSGLVFDVDVLGLPLVSDAMVVNALSPIVDSVAPGTDALLDGIFDALAIRAGNMDVGVPYLKCSNPMLIL